jgi:hypothetical protein
LGTRVRAGTTGREVLDAQGLHTPSLVGAIADALFRYLLRNGMVGVSSLARQRGFGNVPVMSRHTSPNNRRLDDAYPIRVKIRVPPNGLGNLLSDIHIWMQDQMAPDRCQNLPVRAIHQQATAYHFRNLDDAQAFLAAFPMLQLADGLEPPK